MRASEVETCGACGKGVCANGHVTFHRLRFERFGIDRDALNQRVALHTLWSGRASPQLVEAFASSPDVAVLIHEPATVLVCEDCAMRPDVCIMALAETAHARLDARKASVQLPTIEGAHEDQDRRRSDREVAENDCHEV